MSEVWENHLGKLGVMDCMKPEHIPEAIEGYPTPWDTHWGGNGHIYITDANGKPVFHIYCYNEDELNEFDRRMRLINKDTDENKSYI